MAVILVGFDKDGDLVWRNDEGLMTHSETQEGAERAFEWEFGRTPEDYIRRFGPITWL